MILFKQKGDGIEKKHININDILESIINIVYAEIKHNCTLEKDYGNLPPIQCDPQKIGQVFMNLLINATHAVRGTGTISIKTYQ